jgi:hypothetical protein
VGFVVTMVLDSTTQQGGLRKNEPVSIPLAPPVDLQHNQQFENVHVDVDDEEPDEDKDEIDKPQGHERTADDILVPNDDEEESDASIPQNKMEEPDQKTDTVLRAYLEPIDQSLWNVKPLPVRTTTANDLEVIEYPRLTSCSRLHEQFPIDDYPDKDPFLPWIHDVFPTHDGTFIQFVAQNKRRCHTGTTPAESEILTHMQPQVALFQHVPVKRITTSNNDGQTRYRLSSHENAEQDGMATRFICRFKPSKQETLSTFNVDYDYAAFRKAQKHTFTKEGRKDIKSVHTSQLLFSCPVPPNLQETIRSGESVQNDKASLFVDIIPIRTPPRYGKPNQFFPPRYAEFQDKESIFDASKEWSDTHILPRIEDSGRWENIPICKPSLMTYSPYKEEKESANALVAEKPAKKHRLVTCVWASAGYATRGERFAINDGQRRLQEWINFNLLVGVDHFYVYDNSGAHSSNETSLKVITDMFPSQVTHIPWPATVCNNNPNNVDSPGERSSQYAAESSCRLRFGPFTDWIGGFDIDEYLVPMANYTSLPQLLDKLDEQDIRAFSFGSWRAWPRRAKIE